MDRYDGTEKNAYTNKIATTRKERGKDAVRHNKETDG